MESVLFFDTNAILEGIGTDLLKNKFVISSVTLMELEHIKTGTKDQETKYKARKAVHYLNEHIELYETVIFTNQISEILCRLGIPETPDNQICACCDWYRTHTNNDVIFVTHDLCCRIIAKDIFNLNVQFFDKKEEMYKGYQVISGSTEFINSAMEDMDYATWYPNEYLIIQNTDDSSEKEMRFDGTSFVSLKLPSSKFVKAKNSLQRCALDMLLNPNITIAAVLGGYGSGKTFLSLQMALYHVTEKGNHSKILGVRSPQGEGKEIGFLPGTFEEKTESFFLPLSQQLRGGDFELESLKQRGVIESNIPFYMKGTTYNDTVLLVDEAEDLDEKQLRLVGTRVGQNSRIYFAGDYKQSVINPAENNALIKMCNEFKGNPSFGCIYLGEDVRSDTSKMFSHLFEN